MAGEPRCAGTLRCPGGSHLPGDDVARLVTRCDVFGNGAPSRGAVRYARPGSPTMPGATNARSPVRHQSGTRPGPPARRLTPAQPACQPARARAHPVRQPARHRPPSAPARRLHDRDRLTALRWGSNGHDQGRTLTEQQRPELAVGASRACAPSRQFTLTRIASPLAGASAGLSASGPGGSGHCGQPAIPDSLLRQSVSGHRWPVSAIMRTPTTDNRTSRIQACQAGPGRHTGAGSTGGARHDRLIPRHCGSSGRRGS